MLRIIIKTTLIAALILALQACQDDKKSDGTSSSDIPTLNLTKNALWDDPAMKEIDREVFLKKIKNEYDLDLVSFIERSDIDKTSLKELQLVHDTISHSTSIYASYIRLLTLNHIMIDTPADKFNKAFVLKCLKEGYEIAEGPSPVPQSLFFNFWDNCMVGLSNTNNYDDVSRESQKLLEICENQNLPMGVMFAYRALAGNLQDHFDYSTALLEYEKADKAARECLPRLLGKDWLAAHNIEKNTHYSDFMLNYIDMISNQIYCCVCAKNYDWIKENEKLIHQIIEGTHRQPITQICMLFNMAQYYDATGNDSLFQEYISEAEQFKPEKKSSNATFDDLMFYYNRNQTMALHELKLNHVQKALQYMDQIDKNWLLIQNKETYAKIYIKLGRYKEATDMLVDIAIHNKEDLDGRNRTTLTSMSSNIENKKRDIKMMQEELARQHMQQVYNRIIIAIAFIFIIVLAVFLYHQKKLNGQLATALDEAEVANRAKSLFLKNMTHEINTPINQIYGFAQIMADRSMPLDEDSIRMMCDGICESSEHLTKLAANIIEAADKVSELNDLEQTESVLK